MVGNSFSQKVSFIGKLDLKKNIVSKDFKPDKLVRSPLGIIFLDSEKRRVGVWSKDTFDIRGGYGTEDAGLFDPVDIISNQLDVFILDQTVNRLIRYDAQLNFISSFNLDSENAFYPSLFSIDNRQNIYIYYPELNYIYRSSGFGGKIIKFIDLSSNFISDNCISDLAINNADDLALLYKCNKTVNLFSQSGKMIRRFNTEIVNPLIILPFNSSWLIINADGQIQFLDMDPIQLLLDGGKIKDAIIDNNTLILLVNSSLIMYEIINGI